MVIVAVCSEELFEMVGFYLEDSLEIAIHWCHWERNCTAIVQVSWDTGFGTVELYSEDDLKW